MLELLNIRFTFSFRTSPSKPRWQISHCFTDTFRGERREFLLAYTALKRIGIVSATQVAKSDKSASTLNQNLEMILQSAKNSFDELKIFKEDFYN